MSQLWCGYESFDMEGVKLSVCACTAKLELMKKKAITFQSILGDYFISQQGTQSSVY